MRPLQGNGTLFNFVLKLLSQGAFQTNKPNFKKKKKR